MSNGEISVTSFRADNFSAAEPPPERGERTRWYVATLRYLTDLEREVSVPVGVVLFAEGMPLWGIRTPASGEILPALSGEALPGITIMRDLLRGWLSSGELPYAPDSLTRYSLAWWQHLTGLLGHRVRLESIRPTLCESPVADLETLYQVIVRPVDKPRRKSQARKRAGDKTTVRAT
jgi:hypothetical protein